MRHATLIDQPMPRVRPRRSLLGLATILPVFALAFVRRDRAQDLPGKDGWIPLFNGKDLEGWKPKIKGYELGRQFWQYLPGRRRRAEGGL